MKVETALRVPAVVRRNTLLIAISQAFVGAGMQVVPAVSPLMVERLLASAVLAGIGTSILGISRFLVAYPAGRINDTFGRRAGLLLGLALALVGSVVTGLSLVASSFLVFVVGVVVFGMGVGAAQQLRVAAADMYPPSRRAEGLGYVLTGALLGAIGGPVLVTAARGLGPVLSLDTLAMAWLLVPAVVLPSMALILMVRPDPKAIAADLGRYYPGYTPPPPPPADAPKPGFVTFVKHYPKRTAFVTSFALQGVMAMVMAMTSLALSHHGHDLTAISISVAIHVVGMFGFSVPLGRLSDHIGRRKVMLLGLALSAVGSILVGMGTTYWPITAGTFLVGVGWSCGNVATTALLADTTRPTERGRAIGANDTFSSASAIGLPLLGGALVEFLGFPFMGGVGAGLMLLPLVFLLRLREPAPGRYAGPAA